MDVALFPTKGNLIQARNTLRLSRQGYELLDKKRNILIREMMLLIDKAEEIQSQIDVTFREAYEALQVANITIGISTVEQIGHAIPVEDGIDIKFRSIMGVEIPMVTMEEKEIQPRYGFFRTNAALDEAYKKFDKVKKLTVDLAEIENAVYRLANNIKRTQKRANALKNIMIPRYEQITSNIQNALEEKEREEFTRLKIIKSTKS
ncbi:MAG: V/A-type H+/Na+-transporting ATPase subunit [Clostridiales bacterium]|jgi:V/A-type H+-transporting ATPase subunit D|uniref:V-type ATP synthase subunit D n=1 Tax=Petroclostridium xylanilyticum TaxID=1792311 RepID=UPI000B995015|nr:V-type ATP synthase subunit D [Petroclostridium xylanilyticum]MBZ4645714.1 atpD [Clostridia bacterium]MDK2932665.1 V/A-type H+/Na+-transporting ATPase subunit [Clostridiales bacterium]